MSFFSLSKKNKPSHSLVINIGSGSVSGGIAKFTEKPGENIVYFAKEKIPFQEQVSVPKHLELMKSSLTVLANKIRTEGLKIKDAKNKPIIPERIFYVFSSPWSISQTKTIRVKESKPFKVTESYLDKLINQQEKQFQVDISQSGRIIEKKIIQIKVNGYVVNDIVNRQTRDLEISVLFTVVGEEILQAVEQAVAKTFNINYKNGLLCTH